MRGYRRECLQLELLVLLSESLRTLKSVTRTSNNKMRLLTAPYLPEVFEDAATLRSAEDLKCHTPTCALCHGGTATSLLPMPGGSTGLATSMHTGHWDASGYSFCTKLSARPRPRARRRQSEPGARRLAARLRVQPEHTESAAQCNARTDAR